MCSSRVPPLKTGLHRRASKPCCATARFTNPDRLLSYLIIREATDRGAIVKTIRQDTRLLARAAVTVHISYVSTFLYIYPPAVPVHKGLPRLASTFPRRSRSALWLRASRSKVAPLCHLIVSLHTLSGVDLLPVDRCDGTYVVALVTSCAAFSAKHKLFCATSSATPPDS